MRLGICKGAYILTFCSELQARLDDPYRVRCRSSGDTRKRRGREVYIRVLLPVVEVVGNDLFPIAVGKEIDRTRRYDAYERWYKTLEKGTERLIPVDITDDMKRLDEIPQ